MRTVFTLALGAAAGAVAMRFLDPTGRRRRHAVGVAKGVAHSVTPHRHEEMDDATLADRVRSEIFRSADAPKGNVSVDVQAGVAYLRGEVADPAWIDRLAASTRKVDGITGVKNLLHAPGTPTPTAEPRFLASEQFRGA